MTETGKGKGLLFSPLVLPIAVIQGFLFINAAYWWGPDWPAEGVVVYLFLETIFLGWLGTEFVPRVDIKTGLSHWLAGFFITGAVVYGLFTFLLSYDWPVLARAEAGPVMLYTMFFVAPVEELIFRGILPAEVEPHEHWKFRGKRVPVLLFGTQVLFGVFHWAAYGGPSIMMGLAVVLGCIWVVLSRKYSLYFTMASHTAYNILILGVFNPGGV